jgi:tRNA-splicing ligase RtcB
MKQEPAPSTVAMWLTEPLAPEVENAIERTLKSDDVRHVAVLPDAHLSGDVCNGIAIATKDLLYPQAVGADIGCGMLAVGIDLDSEALSTEAQAGRLLAGLYAAIPSNKHPAARRPAGLPANLMQMPLSSKSLENLRHRDAVFQLGTLGRGNHFVEFQQDDSGRVWLMIHSGSRAMGQAITDHHLRTANSCNTGLLFVEAGHAAGEAYLLDLSWATEYASQNRMAMARAVEQLIAGQFNSTIDWSSLIHCHHNHVALEPHQGEAYWIHRKGALPADDGQPGVIPGSMGTHSYHVTGRGCKLALNSSSHGAGRPFARYLARQRISRRELERQMQGVWFDQRRSDSLRDEAPGAYKDIGSVMRAQTELTRITRRLDPVLVYKG